MAQIPTSPVFNAARKMSINIVDDFVNPTVLFPPLYLHINPQNLQITYTKKINRTQTFACYLEEYWGEELDTISCSNSTGGFISEDFGINVIERSNTNSYFKFLDILDVYRNNANTYDEKGRIVKKGDIIISFHPSTYFGFFESFDYTEDATSPFRFTFNFSFKVEKSYTGI